MQVKSNKASATLTDVKNKTGDVFGLADKHGSVLITSYNKPKYVISKYQPSTTETPIPEQKETLPVNQKPISPPTPQPEEKVQKQSLQQHEEPTKDLPPLPEKVSEVEKPQEKPLPEVETIPAEPKPQPVELPQTPTSGSAAFTISAKDNNKSQPAVQAPETENIAEKKPSEPAKSSPLGGLLGIFSHGDGWNRNNNRELNWSKKAKELLG